uniref:CARD domain-containing protein n=1 Tax=Amphimedon queenslandica TaxID=400682 RepID=A0A1X7TD65_AMPQE
DNEKLKLKVADIEEQYLKEKQIITDLRAKVSDNELYTTKLIKEKSQLQERVTSLEEQSIKETSSIGLQFNYLIPSMDKLDCLSDVQVAERKLFLIQGDKPQLMNWEKYGLRIGVEKESLLSSETVEAAVVALVGGEFEFPPNTVLVSAVYAVSLSKPLLKRLILEIQHCVDLTGQPGLSRHLKFAIAPVSTPSLPYLFSIVKGGKFKPDSWYGSIQLYGSPGAVPSLHYSIPLDGVADPKTLFIHRSLRTAPSLTNPTTTSSSTSDLVHESTSVPKASTFRSDIAHRVMTECIAMIKNCGINIHFLVDKLLEHKIINAREKRGITDGYTKQTAGERMDELLHIISSSISMDGEVFGIFLDILREEDTRRTIGLADKLMNKYKSI